MSGLQFMPEHVRLIQAGRKTQTRRRVKGDQPARQRPGRSYAVQPGRGKLATCRVRVLEVRHELLGEITYEDARREGFRSRDEFKRAWILINDCPWFERCLDRWSDDPEQTKHPDDLVPARFESRWAECPVWVVTFKLDTEHRPVLISAGWPDYTTSPALAMKGEPEAVTGAEQLEITKAAGTTHEQWTTLEKAQREADRARLAFEDRLRAARLRSSQHGVSITRELWMVERAIQQQRPPGAVLHMLEGVERKLDRDAA